MEDMRDFVIITAMVTIGATIGALIGSIFYVLNHRPVEFLISTKDADTSIIKSFKSHGDCLVSMEEKMKNGPTQNRFQCVTIKGNVL